MTNAELIVRLLEGAGVRWIFGVPSGPVLPLIEALRGSQVEFVLTASETSAGFMASAVGHLTGRPGVCVATLGPGATNLATGVGAAWLDQSPAIAITCNVPTDWIERRIQMRIDHHALFRPLTKATLPLRNGSVGSTLASAIDLALAEPPGPVHLDLPEDVSLSLATEEHLTSPAARPLPDITAAVVEQVAAALRHSRRPLVVTGLPFTRSRAAGALLQFIERHGLPFVTTLHAKGFLPESHPNWCGVIGRARRSDVQRFTDQADVILAFGYDPIEINYEEWVTDRPVLHVSFEPAEVGPSVALRLNAAGDMDAAIRQLANLESCPNDWRREELAEHRARLDQSLRPASTGLAPHAVLDLLRERLPSDAILAYDVGAHTHQIASQWRTDVPWTCISTNGWSSMGYGIPAAYAAKLVYPDRTVVGVVGDGCFQMTAGELNVGRRLGLAAPIVVLNDGWLGLLKVKQERKGFAIAGTHLGASPESPPHYFGVPCRGARTVDELREALDWALSERGPTVIEAFVDADVYSKTVYD